MYIKRLCAKLHWNICMFGKIIHGRSNLRSRRLWPAMIHLSSRYHGCWLLKFNASTVMICSYSSSQHLWPHSLKLAVCIMATEAMSLRYPWALVGSQRPCLRSVSTRACGTHGLLSLSLQATLSLVAWACNTMVAQVWARDHNHQIQVEQ